MTSEQSTEQPVSESTANQVFDVDQQEDTDALFPIVGIAASAGGLEAFTQVLKHLLTDTGMAFVLIQHLDPNHKSLLSEILGRTTKMPVIEVQDGMTVEPNKVYIIPPNTKMILSGGVLQLTPREKVLGKYMPGDAFFTSLAAEQGRKAIAVVLSGADGDGSLGLTAIKKAGGVTFAQCEDNEELRTRNLELQQVNNDLTNLLASINIPILILTSDLRVRRFTPMAQQLFNLIPADAGRPLSDIRANLDVPDLETLILEVQDTLSIKELEVQTLGGHWYNLRIRPYRTTENKIDGVVLVLVDIDGLKRSAATLEEARNYAEAIVETVQVPLIVLDSDLRVNKANRSFYETFQVSPLETAQSLIFELGNGQWNLPGLRSLLEDILANDTSIENWEVEHSFERIGKKTMLLNGWKIIQQGDAQRILLAVEDISESKQFELERSQLLAQEQSARQEAQIANRSKDEFLSNLSHELRNPLNIILGWAELFRTRDLDSSAVTRAWEVVERSAKVQAQLINDMLDVSRITSGKLHLKTYLIDLVSVVNVAIESIQLSAEAKSIQIVSHLNSAMVVGDFDRLQQILWNLLSNAIKFTPADGRVEIILQALDTHAQIQVRDTGIGISADLLPYVFDRFRQGDSSSSKTSQGLGLGLSIVRHLIELHGGTVQAQSPGAGKGTTITVRLPLRSMPPEITPPTYLEPSVLSETQDTLNGKNPSFTLEGLCILAVDDQADSRDLIKWMLEEFGAEVVVVTSAREAIAALTKSPGKYDLLLADIGMPEEDGFSLIRQVRSLEAEAGGQIPAAAITAYATAQERQKAIDAGFQMHLAKPIDLAQLVLMIANLSGRVTDNS